MEELLTLEDLNPIFDLVDACKGVEQEHDHHPEGDVYTHLMQTVNRAFKETHDIDLILAALLHDVGKQVITHGHEEQSVEMLKDLVSPKVLWLIEHHMRVWKYIDGGMKRQAKCQYLIEHPWFVDLIQLARWDKMGRVKGFVPKLMRQDIVDRFNKTVEERWVINGNKIEKILMRKEI